MVGVSVCINNGIEPRRAGPQNLLPEIGRRVDNNVAAGVRNQN
jgi:hypothetical protein